MWITTNEAAAILCVAPRTLYACDEWSKLTRRPAGRSPRGTGWLWLREEVEQIRDIKRREGGTPSRALRAFMERKDEYRRLCERLEAKPDSESCSYVTTWVSRIS